MGSRSLSWTNNCRKAFFRQERTQTPDRYTFSILMKRPDSTSTCTLWNSGSHSSMLIGGYTNSWSNLNLNGPFSFGTSIWSVPSVGKILFDPTNGSMYLMWNDGSNLYYDAVNGSVTVQTIVAATFPGILGGADMALDNNGVPVFAYALSNSSASAWKQIYVMTGPTGTPTEITWGNFEHDQPSIAIDSNGGIHVVWTTQCDDAANHIMYVVQYKQVGSSVPTNISSTAHESAITFAVLPQIVTVADAFYIFYVDTIYPNTAPHLDVQYFPAASVIAPGGTPTQLAYSQYFIQVFYTAINHGVDLFIAAQTIDVAGNSSTIILVKYNAAGLTLTLTASSPTITNGKGTAQQSATSITASFTANEMSVLLPNCTFGSLSVTVTPTAGGYSIEITNASAFSLGAHGLTISWSDDLGYTYQLHGDHHDPGDQPPGGHHRCDSLRDRRGRDPAARLVHEEQEQARTESARDVLGWQETGRDVVGRERGRRKGRGRRLQAR